MALWHAVASVTLARVMATEEPPVVDEARRAQLMRLWDRFLRIFGAVGEERCFLSPGRVNLLGAHLDYSGGPVMPMAIDRGTFMIVRARGDDVLHLASTLEEETFQGSLRALPPRPRGAWFDYPLGVLRHLLRDGGEARGADVLFGGDLPVGAGLSSSASICVGTAYAFDALWETGIGQRGCIEAALWGEREFVGVKCGIMDPYAVAMTRPGHLLWLDCKDASVEHLPLDTGRLTIGVADSGVRRELAQVAFNERVRQCARAFEILRPHQPGATCLRDVSRATAEAHAEELQPVLLRRVHHVVSEVERTFAAREALSRGDLASFGRALTESHASLRDLYEVSIPELDLLVETACSHPGVLGARLTGAGFGGCMVMVLESSAREGLAECLEGTYREAFGRLPRVEFFRGSGGPREIERNS